ncbi:unnamed protein product [Tilletia laevis]|uniref:Uncharacterized protein n=2 Tax=Tilletia TaxID=13289 RepID=A0A9N8LS30_9BASI|nr:unnamed protein product [Tilletia caries]CAD6929159.1 unnamed protein product [Tilletia controversa]CAD6933459.1 unnamed protein product [Tilletia laevis]CAD6956721.1 unnamed protein product [Tilletia caries]CAD6962709.1 unnamed protein product [Tilletia caries]
MTLIFSARGASSPSSGRARRPVHTELCGNVGWEDDVRKRWFIEDPSTGAIGRIVGRCDPASVNDHVVLDLELVEALDDNGRGRVPHASAWDAELNSGVVSVHDESGGAKTG